MRANRRRAAACGATALAVTMTGSLLAEAGATQPATGRASGAAMPEAANAAATRDLLRPMRGHDRAASSPKNPGNATATAARRGRPNVVVIMTDDMRDDDLRSPWMRRTRKTIARQGVTFRNSFAPTPLCAPARASFLTGKYVHNHGVRAVREPYGFHSFRDRNTLPVWLRRAGYNTIYLGKYINGYGRQRTNNGKPSTRYVPPGWTDWRASLDTRGTYNYWNTHLNRNGRIRSLRGRYQTNAYGKIARHIIKRYSGRRKPFYLNLSFTAPHVGGPKEVDDPKKVRTPARAAGTIGDFNKRTRRLPGPDGEPFNKHKPRPVSNRSKLTKLDKRRARVAYRQRAEALSSVDRQVQSVVRTLRRNNELKNTYIIFTSDNGYFLGQARRVQGKTLHYTDSLSTPLVIRGPGIPRGKVRRDPFTSIDFAPTIADMANARVRGKVDGKSMLRVARNGDRGWKRPILTNTGARHGKKNWGRGVRVRGYLYGRYNTRRPRRELYNLKRDPHSLRNVVHQKRYRDTRKRLAKVLRNRRNCSGVACRIPVRNYQ